jgi:hypothetical protein
MECSRPYSESGVCSSQTKGFNSKRAERKLDLGHHPAGSETKTRECGISSINFTVDMLIIQYNKLPRLIILNCTIEIEW